MYLFSIFILLLFFISPISCKFTTVDEVKDIFGSAHCIKGSLSSFSLNSAESQLSLKESHYSSLHPVINSSLNEDNHDKSAMMKVHELAQYNSIKYFYKLEKEEGPPHNKKFTVSLKIGDEKFLGEGTTLKKAQHNAANIALENTNYEPPPFKETTKNMEALTPSVLLNNLGAKLGIPVTYYLINKDMENLVINSKIIGGQSRKSYLQKLNESVYADNDIHVRKDEPQLKGPFKVLVEVGDDAFYGVSYTVQSARHEAATKAVDHLIKKIQEGNSVCIKEDSKECKQAKANIKSPISLIYEAAKLRNLDLEFEIINEQGPSHKKVFTTQCQLGHLTTTGQGKSKKESKKNAAINMLDKVAELPEVPQEVVVSAILKDKNQKSKKKKHKVLKTKFDMINMHVDNLIESVLESVPIISSSKSDVPTKKTTTPKQKPISNSYQEKILEISNLLNFDVQFLDFEDKNEYFSIMSIDINPDHICLGDGPSTKSARNKAAEGGLKLLRNVPLDSHLKSQKLTLLESDLKKKIFSLLYQDTYEEK